MKFWNMFTRRVKFLILEYVLWLYNLACIAWLLLRLGDFQLPTSIVVFGPFVPAFLLCFIENSVARKIFDEANGLPVWKYEAAFSIILSIVMGWVIVDVRPMEFFTQGANTVSIVRGIFNPNTKILVPMLAALVETIYLALMATVLAIPFAFILSFFAAKNLMFGSLKGRIVYFVIRTLSTIFRSIEAIVWAIIFCVWVGIGPFAGMLALWIHSIAALVKLYSEQIENIDPGPVEAITATGASRLQVWRYGVVPQIFAPYLAFTIYRWDINIRMATIVGFVGGGGIGLALFQQQQLLSWRNVGLIMWLIALVVWIMDMFSGYIRQKLVPN